jgi:hypothetical protein
MGIDCEQQVLKAMGLDLELPESGCCGMAGSFGFEPGATYEVSVKCGERVLLPAVRAANGSDLIIADGFSCKTQIEQSTERRGLHLAQVLQLAIRHGECGPKDERPEDSYVRERRAEFQAANKRALVTVAGFAATGLLAWMLLRARAARK